MDKDCLVFSEIAQKTVGWLIIDKLGKKGLVSRQLTRQGVGFLGLASGKTAGDVPPASFSSPLAPGRNTPVDGNYARAGMMNRWKYFVEHHRGRASLIHSWTRRPAADKCVPADGGVRAL